MWRLRTSWVPLVLFGLLAIAPLVLPAFRLNLLGKYLCFALVAMGLNLAWGFTGMLSLGQGVFFGLGAYAMGMYLKLEASGAELPDFMFWSGLEDLPAFWRPFSSGGFAVLAAVMVPAAVAGVLGLLLFRRRIRGVYFAIITQALALIFATLLVGQQPYTGGTNGLTNLKTIFGRPIGDAGTQLVLYFATLGSVVGGYLLLRWLTGSRFGRLLVAVREGENRVRFLGYDPARVKVIAFSISAALAGLGGALFVPQVGIISPTQVGVVPSIEMVVWVTVGGRGALLGGVLGAVVVNAAKTSISEALPSAWLYLMGGLFIASVTVFPRGLVGVGRSVAAWVAGLRKVEEPVAAPRREEVAA